MRTPTRTLVAACALSAALVVAGCGGGSHEETRAGDDVLLQPVADRGPDPFTDSTATSSATPSPVTRTPGPARSGRAGLQPLSGETPGLYGGTRGAGSCDVQRQIDQLTADRARGRVFAQAAGIPQASLPGYLRGLTSVVLRADTRVTNHGFRDGMGTGYQSVLQAGTAVLVDSRGVPRVRCACGNPLAPPVDPRGRPGTSGRAWSGYRPGQVIVVAPTPQAVTNITIIDIADNTWIERPLGHHGHDRDHVVRPPKPVTPTPDPHPHDSASGTAPGERTFPPESPADCTTPADVTDAADTATADCPSAAGTASPPTTDPGRTPASPESPVAPKSPDEPSPSDSRTEPDTSPTSPDSRDTPEETGPETVPDSPDVPDGGGLVPDDPGTSDSIFGSPTDVFDG
ncbi:DUF6777 domain-containing protein [Streptomyces viridochromogenes]|uniref:DUF6777 domain-containing protein n=1 Tax=Streptomyces viridochromogenes TaxID=1938 RepID=UPI00069DC8F0|nr:DUF6777 domain-containing protein [Streptomyces viridochromogenes]KOG20486.1 hypothetical protein ADK36_17050 [Streptomyces viridochromogenes]KOG22328.1 hypothetical protein ADK35_15660 [Streptomyces viridochromogenes]